MGVNIVLVELVGEKNAPHYDFPVFITKRIEWFDSYRHVGDRGFHKYVLANGICNSEDKDALYPDLGAVRLWRVNDVGAARKWVTDNIPAINHKRLFDALDHMEQQKTVYFDFR